MQRFAFITKYGFSLRQKVFDALYIHDKSSKSYQLINSSIHTKVQGINQMICTPTLSTYTSSKLPSGITVLTESVSVPTNVQLGIFIDVGTRDEDAQTSGSMLSLKNTYMKTAINTNQTVNYGIAQMAGGEFEMNYNRQSAFYRVNCLSHDVIDVFSMLSDCAFEPKNFVSANVGIQKNQQSHKLQNFLGGNQIFNDSIYQTAYGKSNLGMPIHGSKSNVTYLTAFILQRFQRENITPNRIVISATGVQNHQQFVDLVEQKMSITQLSSKAKQRSQATYIGGEVRNLTDSSSIHIALAFEGANHRNALPLLVAQEVLGNQRKFGRIQNNILNKNVFINGAQSFSTNYTDTGLFGLKVGGSAAHASEVLNVAANQLNALRSITNGELENAKSVLKRRLSRQFTKNDRRIEDRSKSLYYLGETGEDFGQKINKISVESVQDAVSKALKSKLTIVVQGGDVQKLPSYDKISALFN